MSLRGIDISNHQGDNGFNLGAVKDEIDFVICKATGGNYFVDDYCDGFIMQAKLYGLPWGFYHFGNDGLYSEPEEEADFFIENCRNYFKDGIPILDWETDYIDIDWVNRFVRKVHNETGVWPWIYGNAWRFTSEVEQNCGRWVASYPSSLLYPPLDVELPEEPECNGLMCAWQFASDGRLNGYSGNLDFNVFYGDAVAWKKYAQGDVNEETYDDIVEKLYESKDFDIDLVWHRYYS